MVSFKVNGDSVTADTPAEVSTPKTLLEVLRGDLDILSPKDGCAPQGVCGCCTVLIDGKPQMACRKSCDAKLEGKEVTTLEGFTQHKRDVLGRAFVATGGLQCGYCIPGIAVRASALLDKNASPSREDVQKALSTHICRCTGYEKIIDAVQLAGAHWGQDSLPDLPDEQGVGGKVARYRGLETVMGLKPYVDDMQLPDMLHGATLLSAHPRAKVLSIDTSAAEALDGVVCVTTAADVPGERVQGLIEKDWPVYIAVGEETRTVGDHLASVAATTRELAREAVKRIVVEYEVLEPVTSPEDALEDDAPKLHEKGNHLRRCVVRRGDIDEAFANCAHVVEETFVTQRIDQGFLEPQSCVVEPKPNGRYAVFTQGQGVHDDQKQLASVLGVDEQKVKVTLLSNGGGFGGKEDLSVQAQTALLAMKAGKPVKLTVTRDQCAVLHAKRHPLTMHYKMGVDAEGHLLAVQARMIGDTGAYASVGDKVLERAAGHSCGPYHIQQAVDVVADTVYTNNLPCGAMRGFGANQASFAVESLVDALADKVGIDGYQMRERNLLEVGEAFSTGQLMDEGLGVKETLEAVKDDYYAAKNAGRSVGIACGVKNTGIGNGMPDIGRVAIHVQGGGKLHLTTGYTEMGQGLFTLLQQIVHDHIGVAIDDMTVECLSDESILCGMTTASRATALCAEAAYRASQKMKAALADASLADLEGQTFLGEYICDTTTKPGSEKEGEAPKTHMTFSYATQVVILDDEGIVDRVVAAHDVGRIMNRLQCEGQIEGAVHMGLGYALTEDLPMQGGHPLSTNYDDLRILRAKNTPKIDVKLIEVKDPNTHYGAKGVGEIGLVPTAGAVAAALKAHDGIMRTRLPMRGSAAARACLPKRLHEDDHA